MLCDGNAVFVMALEDLGVAQCLDAVRVERFSQRAAADSICGPASTRSEAVLDGGAPAFAQDVSPVDNVDGIATDCNISGTITLDLSQAP